MLALCEDFQSNLHQTLHDNDPKLNFYWFSFSKSYDWYPHLHTTLKHPAKVFLRGAQGEVSQNAVLREAVPHHGSHYCSIYTPLCFFKNPLCICYCSCSVGHLQLCGTAVPVDDDRPDMTISIDQALKKQQLSVENHQSGHNSVPQDDVKSIDQIQTVSKVVTIQSLKMMLSQ